MRHTKIVATIGPASAAADTIDALLAAGVDVFRLNFSHGSHETHAEVYRRIRSAAARQTRHVAILQDLSGPKIRTGPIAGGGPLMLRDGEQLRLAAGDGEGTPGQIFTPYAELVRSAQPGDRLLLDDGKIELRVVSAGAELTTVVVNGGPLGGKKGINAPGVTLPTSAVTEKDAVDLRFGLELGVDMVALSFVQRAEEIQLARDVMAAAAAFVPIVAKIERPSALQNLTAILAATDGVMVARGDLGLEMPLEQVPRAQKAIIRASRAAGRPVILATQVLESMRVEPRPTRAEVSDAANAVDEGADAIMLSGETAVGAFPVRAVETLAAVICDAELVPSAERVLPDIDTTGSLHGRALCEAAVTLATTGQADAIVAVTREGKTARLLSSLRPPTPVFAVTDSGRVAGALTLYRGITPVVSAERDLERLAALLLERHSIRQQAVVVYINVSPELNRVDANFLNVQRIG